MFDRSPPARLALCFAIAVAAGTAGCVPSPTVEAALGRTGPYVTVRGTREAGLAEPPSSGWPPRLQPSKQPATGPGCRDDKTRLQRDLELESIACPALQSAVTPVSSDADRPIAGAPATPATPAAPPSPATPPAPSLGDADQPIGNTGGSVGDADAPVSGTPASGAAPAALGTNLTCYDLGKAMLVAEYAYHSTACTQLVGLAVFHKR